MKKRTIYLPEWLDKRIARQAKEERRSFSSQIVYELDRWYRPTPYFAEKEVWMGWDEFAKQDDDDEVIEL